MGHDHDHHKRRLSSAEIFILSQLIKSGSLVGTDGVILHQLATGPLGILAIPSQTVLANLATSSLGLLSRTNQAALARLAPKATVINNFFVTAPAGGSGRLAPSTYATLGDLNALVPLEPNISTLNELAEVANLARAASAADLTSSDVLATMADVQAAINTIMSNFGETLTMINSALGGSGTTNERIHTIDSDLLVSPTGVVADDLNTVRSLLVTVQGDTLETDVETLISALDNNALIATSSVQNLIGDPGNAVSISAMIGVANAASVVAALGNTGENQSSISNLLGGSASGVSLYDQIVGSNGVLNKLDATTVDSGNITSRLASQIEKIDSSATQLSTAITNVKSLIGGNMSDLDLVARIGNPGDSKTIIGNIGGSASNVQDSLNSVSTVLFGNSNFNSSLLSQTTAVSTAIDNGLNSLPGSAIFATVSAINDDGSGGVDLTIVSGLGSANGTYNLSAAAIADGITNGNLLTLTNGGNNLVLANRSGSTINSQSQALTYLSSMYPINSQISAALSDKIVNGLNRMLGATGSSTRARISAIDTTILQSPTGVVTTDLLTARALLVASPGSNLQEDSQTLNTLLNGAASGSTVQARIGTPQVNATNTNLASVIGSSSGDADLAMMLGDPVIADTGLSALIKASTTTNTNSIWTDVSGFQNATTIYDQLNAFLALFNNHNWTNSSDISITFTCTTPPTNLAELINMATITSS